MAAAESMGTTEGNDLTVVEAHAVEDGAEVRLLFCAVGEAAVRGTEGHVAVGTTRAPRDDGACVC